MRLRPNPRLVSASSAAAARHRPHRSRRRLATVGSQRWRSGCAGPTFRPPARGSTEVFEQRLDNSKIRCCSKGCRGGRRAHALVVRRRGQKLQQSGMQILVSCSCRKPVLCRECRDRCPGALADDPIDLAGIEASRGRSAATARRARGDPTILPWKGSCGRRPISRGSDFWRNPVRCSRVRTPSSRGAGAPRPGRVPA